MLPLFWPLILITCAPRLQQASSKTRSPRFFACTTDASILSNRVGSSTATHALFCAAYQLRWPQRRVHQFGLTPP
ncbi:hypothetical protein GE09DRAFT_1164874 [Coniochaeta sp. 2T2.1]|nr:hypothetical protein GE09DRAFT_1164874 [Coniochaeta sp. 2T2.1]